MSARSTARAPVALAILVVVALAAGLVSLEQTADQVRALEGCEAASRGDWASALARTQGLAGPDATGRAAAECRCTALLATGAGEGCADLLAEILADPASGDWAPPPELAVPAIQIWRQRGGAADAALLARRAARRHPESADLFYLELVTRSALEDEGPLLQELQARVPDSGEAATRMRVSVATRYLLRGDPATALAALGDAPPPGAGPALAPWFDTRAMAHASTGDLPAVRRTYARWHELGGDPDELFARYAFSLSISGLQSPEAPTVALLEKALSGASRFENPKLEEALTIRLVLQLVADGRRDEALAAYERGRRRFELAGLSRQELERSAALETRGRAPLGSHGGALRFAVADPAPGWEILLSPDPAAPLDADFERLVLGRTGDAVATRGVGSAPARWVLRDARGFTLASGTATPRPGEELRVEIAPGAPVATLPVTLSRRPADARRRVVLLVLDCADWRIAGYLRARGELPVFERLLALGNRAVLHMEPPLTAAALEALVWPERRSGTSVAGLVHQLGVELAGLSSVGENPFAALAWILPEDRDLFAAIGEGPLSAANLLFAHGGIRAGRHSEVTGPHGTRRRVPLSRSARDLDAAERARFPALAEAAERDAIHVRTIAAELDAAEELVRAGDLDLLALRVEPLDILTHAHFAEAVRDGQDDGRGLLFEVYRYLDARVGTLHDLLDEDDVLVVMSDHGIRTAMEHSPWAIFVAVGGGVPPGRNEGAPALRGVPRAIADLLGVETDWPDTGVAPWAVRLARSEAKAHPAGANH
jgi:hypothetical protein